MTKFATRFLNSFVFIRIHFESQNAGKIDQQKQASQRQRISVKSVLDSVAQKKVLHVFVGHDFAEQIENCETHCRTGDQLAGASSIVDYCADWRSETFAAVDVD